MDINILMRWTLERARHGLFWNGLFSQAGGRKGRHLACCHWSRRQYEIQIFHITCDYGSCSQMFFLSQLRKIHKKTQHHNFLNCRFRLREWWSENDSSRTKGMSLRAHREKGMEQMLSPDISDAGATDISSRNLENLWRWVTAFAKRFTGCRGWGVTSFPSSSNTCKHILYFFFRYKLLEFKWFYS